MRVMRVAVLRDRWDFILEGSYCTIDGMPGGRLLDYALATFLDGWEFEPYLQAGLEHAWAEIVPLFITWFLTAPRDGEFYHDLHVNVHRDQWRMMIAHCPEFSTIPLADFDAALAHARTMVPFDGVVLTHTRRRTSE